jgi:hypothetical protein
MNGDYYNMSSEELKAFCEKKLLGQNINKILSGYYREIQKNRKSLQVQNCASWLMFKSYADEKNTKKLYRANFCKNPLCLMCSWRLARQRFRELEEAVKVLCERDVNGRFYFLTLTVQNWKVIKKSRLQEFQKQGVKFIREVLKTSSYYLSLEITIGKDRNYHPHLHALVYTTGYLDTTLDSIAKYRKAWGSITHSKMSYQLLTLYPLGYDDDGRKNLHEVTKYILKPEIKICSEMVINVSESIENVKKGFSSGEVKIALREAKKHLYERDIVEQEVLNKNNWEIEIYKWLGNDYILDIS